MPEAENNRRKPPNLSDAQDNMKDAASNHSLEEPPLMHGRPMNRRDRAPREEMDLDEIEPPHPGALMGGTRSPKVLQKNRKKRAA